MANNHNLTAFLIGAVAGGTTALLFAPTTGEQLRDRISERSNELKELTATKARRAADKAREGMDSARGAARTRAVAVGQAVDEGKAAYWRELEKAKVS